MDADFQTSFIPKKPVAPAPQEKGKPISFLSLISLLIFFTMLIATGVMYFYKGTLSAGITKMQNDLKLAENRFEPATLAKIELLDRRLKAANIVLGRHMAVSPIFKELEKVTIKSVRFTSFDYKASGTKNQTIEVKLAGVASDYTSVALQSEFLNQNKYFLNPVFSNLALNEKGNVTFDLEFSVDQNFVNYEKLLAASASGANQQP